MSEDVIETAILSLLEKAGPEKSIAPADAAREVFPNNWRDRMRHVRNAAIHLARQGKIVVLRKGKPVDHENFKGVYRLALAPDAASSEDDTGSV